jgi:hypothetical protein
MERKHSTIHHGYSIALYVTVSFLCLYVAFRILRCVLARGLCRGVAGALRLASRVPANPEFTGSGNIININIKTSNESLAATQEAPPLRVLTPSDSKAGKSEARSTRRLRHSQTAYLSDQFQV